MFLPETQQAAEQHHGHDDDDFGQVDFFTCLKWQPIVGDKADTAQGQQHVDEGVVQCLQELDDSVWRLVMGHFVIAFALQARRGVQFGQAVLGGAYIGEGGRQAIVGFAGGTHRQPGVGSGAIFLVQRRVFYGAHCLYSCRQFSTKHTLYLPADRRAKACRAADFAIGSNKVFK